MRQLAETGFVMLDLANTWDGYLDDPERLPDEAALRRFLAELYDGEPEPTALRAGDLEAVRRERDRLHAVLACAPADRADALARWVDGLAPRAVVTVVNGVPRLRLAAGGSARPADRLAVRAVAELLDLAASGDWERLRRCAAHPCRDAFVDRSRPGRRQFCSTRCANRAHAAASRARRR